MTSKQLAKIGVGDKVQLRGSRGHVTQATPQWFMVSWDDTFPEVVQRRPSILVARLELVQ